MTGYFSSFYRHDCATQGCQILSLPSWDDLLAAFPRGIRPTDIDAMVEINGRFLFIEQKAEGASLREGQRRALAALGEQPNTTVLVIRPIGESLEVLRFPNPTGFHAVERTTLVGWLHAWANRRESA